MAEAMVGAGSIAGFFMLLLAVCSSTSLVDGLVNDVLPDRYTLELRNHRHVGFMLMCVSLLMLGGIFAMRSTSLVLLVSMATPAVFSAVVVWPDMKARHQRTAV